MTGERITAPCGCEFYGRNHRMIDTRRCAVISPRRDTMTGTQQGRHTDKAFRQAKAAAEAAA